MEFNEILTLVSSVAGFLLTCLIPTFIVMINRIKAVRKAKSEVEKQSALNDLKLLAQTFVVEAESLYKDIEAIVKQSGKSCGAVKKDCVMAKIQDACLTKGVVFDKEFWSKEVDALVAVTRQVNTR